MTKEKLLETFYNRSWINNGRRLCTFNKETILFYHLVWNTYNSDDKIVKGDGYAIHHINGNELDDRIENLQKMLNKDHSSMHGIGNKNVVNRVRPIEERERISKTMLGVKKTEKHCENMSKARKGNKNWLGRKHSEESKQKMRLVKKTKKHCENLSKSKKEWWRKKKLLEV